ncbi:MAG: AmmeMemoRadiSam system protein B [Actinomycetota bacterium]|nr:AmmeMemoRadiSam system protein B [Actinomycetota bacterium]
MSTVRRAAVAGLFYPSGARALAELVDRLLVDGMRGNGMQGNGMPGNGMPGNGMPGNGAEPGGPGAPTAHDTRPLAIIAPHAGYVYSGPIAATAYGTLARWRDEITRVVVIGPAHRVAVRGLALSGDDYFTTPLGDVPVDQATNRELLNHRGVYIDDRAHASEHSIEVHLPFLQRVLPAGWSLVPIVAGGVNATTTADALEPLWGAPGTLVVVSSDLSHYHDTHTAKRLDAATAATIVAGRWEELDGERACGAVPVRGVLEAVRRHHQTVQLLDLRNSADTAGSDDRVVGYGSFVVR